jgi:hypothetical protein
MFASSSEFLKISEQTCFLSIFDLHSDSLGACSYTPFFSCWNLLLKLVSPFMWPRYTLLQSFWCMNGHLFSQGSSYFPYFHQFSMLLNVQVICFLQDLLFLLCHSNTWAGQMASSPYASHNNEGFGVSCIQLLKIFDIHSLLIFLSSIIMASQTVKLHLFMHKA